MQKKILSEIYLYTGAIKLPNGVHLDLNALKADIAAQILEEKNSIKFTRNLDILSTYIRDFFRLKSFRSAIEKLSFGSVYKSGESSLPLIGADLMDLKNSGDIVMLYGVDIKKDSCNLCIEYDDNRLKNKIIHLSLNTNEFFIFPSTLTYYFKTNNSKESNYILTQIYELK
jgi:hypothetical protein